MTEELLPIYQGTDIAILFEALEDSNDTPVDIADYDFIAVLSTSPLALVVASTDTSHDVTIVRKGNNSLVVNISRRLTRKLNPGALTISVKAIHRPTNTAMGAAIKIFELIQFNAKDYEIKSNNTEQ